MRDTGKKQALSAGLKMELLFVVWVDEPKRTLADSEPCFGGQSLEMLNSHTRGPDVHQLVDAIACGSAQPQHHSVDGLGQQMDEGEFGSKTDTDLLMAAKRALPGRKAKEHDAVLSQKILQAKKKLPFARWGNMFYHIVNKNNVVASGLIFWLICEKEILADESCLLVAFRKVHSGFVDTVLANVYSYDLTAFFRKREQIAALAATDFQNTSACRQSDVRLQVGYIELAGCVGQFAEILLAIQMSLLHGLFLFCFSIWIDTTKQEKTAWA